MNVKEAPLLKLYITYGELFQFVIMIVAIIALFTTKK